jgi:hypothetical protein
MRERSVGGDAEEVERYGDEAVVDAPTASHGLLRSVFALEDDSSEHRGGHRTCLQQFHVPTFDQTCLPLIEQETSMDSDRAHIEHRVPLTEHLL